MWILGHLHTFSHMSPTELPSDYLRPKPGGSRRMTTSDSAARSWASWHPWMSRWLGGVPTGRGRRSVEAFPASPLCDISLMAITETSASRSPKTIDGDRGSDGDGDGLFTCRFLAPRACVSMALLTRPCGRCG